MWAVRNDNFDRSLYPNQNGSSLTHYGVKGMRWGVRKEPESSGRKRSIKLAVSRKPSNYNDPSVNGANVFGLGDLGELPKEHARTPFGDSYGSFIDFISKAGNSPGFYEYIDKKTNGKIFESVQNYYDLEKKVLDFSIDRELRNQYEEECVALGERYQKLIDEYDKTHMNDATEEEIELNQQFAKMVDWVSGFDSSLLPKGASISMYRRPDGNGRYIYTAPDGTRKYFKYGEESELEAYAKAHSNDTTDFRKATYGRSREKNVDSSAKPVKVTKGKKIEVSDVERLAKSLSRGDDSKSIKAVNDYLDKNPSLKKEVYEKVETQIQKDREQLIDDMKKSRRKSKREEGDGWNGLLD